MGVNALKNSGNVTQVKATCETINVATFKAALHDSGFRRTYVDIGITMSMILPLLSFRVA